MEHAEIRYKGRSKFVAKNRGHEVTIDLPADFGGEDKGPTPPEVFIDALGSCMGVYVIRYCNSAGIDARDLKIKIEWEKELKKQPYYIKKIDVKIDLPNADVGPRKEALLKVAGSCLIHQTIKAQPPVDISLL